MTDSHGDIYNIFNGKIYNVHNNNDGSHCLETGSGVGVAVVGASSTAEVIVLWPPGGVAHLTSRVQDLDPGEQREQEEHHHRHQLSARQHLLGLLTKL